MKRFTLFLALLLCGVGAMFGQTYDATKVYTIHKLAVQDRGYLAYHTDYTNSAGLGLAGVGLSGYVSKHKALTDEGVGVNFSIYQSTKGNTYLYNLAAGKFVYTDGSGEKVIFSDTPCPFTCAATTETDAAYSGTVTFKYNNQTNKYLTSSCGYESTSGDAVKVRAYENVAVNFTVTEVAGETVATSVQTAIATAVEAAESVINVTYVYSIDGTSTTKSVVVSQQANSASAAPAQDYLTIVSYSPANVGTSDCTVNVACTENLPFQKTTDLGAPNWYAMKMHSNQQKLISWSTESSKMAYNAGFNASDYGVVSSDANFWCVTGNVMDGFKLYNKAVGTGSALTYASGDPALSAPDESNTWALVKSTANADWYCFQKPGGGNCYMNLNLTGGKVSYWNAADAGSSCMFLTPASFPVNYVRGCANIPVGAVGNSAYLTAASLSAALALCTTAEADPLNFTKAGDVVDECRKIATADVISLVPGKYYRLQNRNRYTSDAGQYTNSSTKGYMNYLPGAAEASIRVYAANKTDVDNIWKIEASDTHYTLQNPNSGKYIGATSSTANSVYVDMSDAAATYDITSLGSALFSLTYTEETGYQRMLYTYNKGVMNGWSVSPATADGFAWYIFPATDLEVAMNTVDDAAYATAYLPFAVQAMDATAYRVSAQGSTTLTANAVAAVPAQKGVIIKGSQDQATATLSLVDSADDFETLLSGSLVATTSMPAGTIYTLAAEDGIGFYRFTGTTLAANKAYWLGDSGSGAAGMQLVFGGVTAIEALPAADGAEAPLFDLSGRRVVKARKGGLYIRNGHKFIVK